MFPAEGMFLVRAKLTLPDGRVLDGFITPQDESETLDLGIIQPQAFLPSGTRCDFWDGMFRRDPEERRGFYEELASNPQSVFPIEFAAENGLATGHVGGTIPGFCWRPENKTQVYQ